MKIFFFGNVNNYPLILAKELKKKGHEVIFFVDSNQLLFRPENRYKEYAKKYPDWIVDISFLRNFKLFKRFNEFNKIIYKYGSPDLVILNGSVCDYFTNIKSDKFFLATGSDIEEECSYLTAIKLFRNNLKRSFFIALFCFFAGLNVERLKAVVITSEGIFSYNISADCLTEQELDECLETRIEIIAKSLDPNWEDGLLSALNDEKNGSKEFR